MSEMFDFDAGPVPAHRHPNGDGWVADSAWVDPTAWVSGTARVSGVRHVLTVGPVGSENQTVTLWRTATGHGMSIGCWADHTVDELAAEVQRRCPDRADEYAEIEVVLRRRITEWASEQVTP